jgi:hypothetical protein
LETLMNITNGTGIKIHCADVYLLSMTFNAATIHADIAALLPRLRRFARSIT